MGACLEREGRLRWAASLPETETAMAEEEKQMRVVFYYSSTVEPGSQYFCDNAKAKKLVEALKAAGVSAEVIDSEVNPPGFMKYNAAVTGPSASKRAVFGTKGALEEEFGKAVPALLIYAKDGDRYPEEVFPRSDREINRIVGIEEALQEILSAQAK